MSPREPLFLGWSHKKKTNNTHIYIRIKNQKIWIEEDWTEEGIANELLREGVPKEDIVLAFYPPEDRKITDECDHLSKEKGEK